MTICNLLVAYMIALLWQKCNPRCTTARPWILRAPDGVGDGCTQGYDRYHALQNRVTPFARSSHSKAAASLWVIEASSTTMRGESFGFSQVRRWIACRTEFPVDTERYAPALVHELFFLDEATALGAATAVCGMSQRRLSAIPGFVGKPVKASGGECRYDGCRKLHAERACGHQENGRYRADPCRPTPDGTYVPSTPLPGWSGETNCLPGLTSGTASDAPPQHREIEVLTHLRRCRAKAGYHDRRLSESLAPTECPRAAPRVSVLGVPARVRS